MILERFMDENLRPGVCVAAMVADML